MLDDTGRRGSVVEASAPLAPRITLRDGRPRRRRPAAGCRPARITRAATRGGAGTMIRPPARVAAARPNGQL